MKTIKLNKTELEWLIYALKNEINLEKRLLNDNQYIKKPQIKKIKKFLKQDENFLKKLL